MATTNPSASTIQSATSLEGSPKNDQPILAKQLPLFKRLDYGIHLWSFKIFVTFGLGLLRFVNYITRRTQPSYTRRYPSRPKLEVRVFIPPGTDRSTAKLPTYINIHGGGFALCNPIVDDHFCYALSHKYNHLVVSLAYSLSPPHPFPVPVHDIQALVESVLADTSLPIDPKRVALGGFSAGGNLALVAAQNASISSRIQAIVPIYPVVDYSGKYKGPLRTTPDGQEDRLKKMNNWFYWGYIRPGTDLTDPMLSPIYEEEAFSGKRMLFIGAEYDCLCHEAFEMARKLAKIPADEADEGANWEQNGITWKRVDGVQHGYTHEQEYWSRKREAQRLKITDETWAEVASWLEKTWKEVA
jgi:acetyl esterase/lipase